VGGYEYFEEIANVTHAQISNVTHAQGCMGSMMAAVWPQGPRPSLFSQCYRPLQFICSFNTLTRLYTLHKLQSISLCRFKHPRRRGRSHSQPALNSSGLTMCLRPSGRLTSLRLRSNGHTFEARPGISLWLMPSLSKYQPRGTPARVCIAVFTI
jgi:hypothetical protein